jgi:hypothetical protein
MTGTFRKVRQSNLKERDAWDEPERDGLIRHWKTLRTKEGAGMKLKQCSGSHSGGFEEHCRRFVRKYCLHLQGGRMSLANNQQAQLCFDPGIWKQYVVPKRRCASVGLHGVRS